MLSLEAEMGEKKAMAWARVLSQEVLNEKEGIFSLWIETDLSDNARPGQFIDFYLADPSRILPRPISICEIDRERHAMRCVYRIAGEGTWQLSVLKANDAVRIMAPLGNGYPELDGRALMIGGGIGIPPLLELTKELSGRGNKDLTAVLGYRSKDSFLLDEFEHLASVYISTDDGSAGTHGTVLDCIREHGISGKDVDMIYACGPLPMLRGVKAFAEAEGIRCYLSLEERMACGVGACLGCVTKSVEVDSHSKVKNKRVCTDGPVFDAREVDI